MQNLKKTLAAHLSDALGEITGTPVDRSADLAAMLEYPPESAGADLALPCFRFSKELRKAPPAIASALAETKALADIPGIGGMTVAGGYLNFTISDDYYTTTVLPEILTKGSDYGRSDMGQGKTVVLDYSSPNVAKPFHIGHLGTTVIGHSLKRLHEYLGYTCVGVNHLGDWGTQFGKLIVAYRLWGDRAKVEADGVDELVALYVRFHEEAEQNPELNDQARAEFTKLEQNDPDNIALWKWFIELSLAEYEKTYKQLGITFESYNGESFYVDKVPAQAEILREKGLLKVDDGASVVDLSEYNMPPCLVFKKDGSTIYHARDIAAAVYRKETYDFEKCIYVTSSQQSLHFAQLFKVIELMGYEWYDKMVHVPYGTISVDGVKLSTRHGNVLLLRDVFAAAIEKVTDVMNEKNPDLPDKEATAEAVGVGAVIFYYLLNNRIKDISFKMDDALSFEGSTGPYVQYTYARTCSILEKAGDLPDAPLNLTSPAESELCKALSRFGESVLRAAAEYEPSVMTRYILALATAFNHFYHECPILGADDPAVKATRVALTKATKTVLQSALPLICLKTPEKI